MNKLRYRIVFNRVRGLLMAVAEYASGQGKSPGEHRAGNPTDASRALSVRRLAFNCWAAFGLVLIAGNTQAQIVAYKNAPAGQAPTVLSTANGIPLVNIRTPNASGLSHNSYTQFDVAANGAILNNSPDNVQTQLGGWVQGNPWLATGSARVILNEVYSNNPSYLNGYIEVAGQRAQVIIANPSGISCNGCGFINANRATLTTGVPVISANGNLDGYRVQGGQITIGGAGLDASTADYTDVIARAVQVNAGIWTKQLKVVAGANQVDAAVTSATPISGTGTVPANAIDVAALGGMYAQKIVLVGTEAGVGVRNAGNINASVGDVVVTSAGRLENSKTISATGKVQASAQGDLINSGTLYAEGNTALTSQGNLDNTGVIAAAGHTTLAAEGANSTITSHTGSVLGASVRSDGTLGSAGNLNVSATQSVTVVGQNLAGGDQTITSHSIDLSASQTSGQNITLTASAGDVTLTQASVAAGGIFSVSAAQTVRTDGATVNANQLAFSAHDISNRYGTLAQLGTGDLSVSLLGDFDNTGGKFAGNNTNLSWTAHNLINTDGKIQHAGTGALALHATTLSGTRGEITSNGSLDLQADTVTLDQARTTAVAISIVSQTLSHRGGTLQQTGTGTTALNATTRLDNTGGQIATNGGMTLGVGEFVNQQGSLQVAGGDLALTASGAIDNTDGTLKASGNATQSASRFVNLRGVTTAGRTLTARFNRDLVNVQGLFAAQDDLRLTTASTDNTQGTLAAVTGNATLKAQTGAFDNTQGAVQAAQLVQLDVQGLTNTNGLLAGASVKIDTHAQTLINTQGRIIAQGMGAHDQLSILSGALDNDGGLLQGGTALIVDTHGQTLTNTNAGSAGGLVSQGTLSLASGDLNNTAGFIGGKDALTLSAVNVTNTQDGIITGGATIDLAATALDNRGGQIQGVGNATVTLSAGLDNTGGLVRSGGTLTAAADTLKNVSTQGADQGLEGAAIALSARQIDNTDGAMRANTSLSQQSSGSVDNTRGLMSSGGTLSVQDANPAAKALSITNSGGRMVAQTAVAIDSASLTGDGTVASNGDVSVKLTQDYTHTGTFQATGNASLETTGKVTNQATLQAGDTLTVKAADIDNQASGTIQAAKLALAARNTFTNRGLIDSQETVIETGTLNNLGTGRIYGDHVALSATTLNNAPENGVAPVIAARDRLDLGVGTLNNSEHALIFSAGDLALGRSFDANQRATGQADALNNSSATVESLGAMDLNVKAISNTNAHFSSALQTISTESLTEYQGSGSATRYLAGTPDVYTFVDESLHLHTPENPYFETWSAYNYTRTIQEDRVTRSDPAKILAGGGMRLTSDTVTNDKSQIVAGGTLSGTIGTLTNTEVPGQHIVTDSGTVTNYWRNHKKGRDDTGSSSAAYNPPDVIQSISLTPTVYQQNTVPTGSGTQVVSLNNSVATAIVGSAGSAQAGVPTASTVSPVTQVASVAGNNASGSPTVVRSGGINTTVPNNSLYRANLSPNSHVLIETDPRFANYRTWLSSDYMLQALSFDPVMTQKRLGDGFYEQRLIREQVGQLTGRRFLDGYASDEAEYQALMDNGVTVAKAWHLRPGVALTAAQVAQLTSDIVWLVEQTVSLPDGSTQKVLVPQVYVRVRDGDLTTAGALISGSSVNLNLTGDLINQGTIAGRDVVALTAENIKNLGGRIQGSDTRVEARNDLLNLGGSLTGGNRLTALAGHDLTVESATRTQTNANGSRSNIDRVAGLYVTGSGGTLLASAGNDLNLIAAAVQSQGSATLAAGNNVNLGTATEASSNRIAWDGNNRRSDRTTNEIGTVVQSQGNTQIIAVQDINARAANVTSDKGAIFALAERDINLSAGQSTAQVEEAHQHTSKGFLNSTTRSTKDSLNESTAQGSTFSGNTVNVAANRDVSIKGSNVISTAGTQVSAGQNLTIEAATNTREEEHLSKKTTSGLMSSGFGITVGTRAQSTDGKGVSTGAAGSTVGSTDGNVVLKAGEKYIQEGSDVLAPQGDIAITAKQVAITEARETTHNETESKFTQSGLTLALTSPVITAIQTAQQMSKASKQTSDDRMKVLAAANTGMAAASAAAAVQDSGSAAGGVNLAISIGGSQSKSNVTQNSDSGHGSSVKAGGDVAIVATGAGKESNLTIQGSDVKAGNNVLLAADNDINLLAGKNTADQKSTNSSISGSVGISIGTSGFGVTVSASGARGKADGNDVTYDNTQVEAGRKLSLESGGNTTVRGAVAKAEQIQAEVGGNLKVESLQDTSHFESKQQSIGASVTIGAGVSGSVSASSSKTNSNYASVAEQSGFKAGDGGFQVDVKGDTDLKGGTITSTQKAIDDGKNRFQTGGTLSTSDIQNTASYSAKSLGATLGTNMANDGNFKPAGNSAGIGSDKGKASSTTQAAISGVAGNTAARTGDKETGINKIFDADKVQKDINAQVLITQTFGAQASKAVGDYAGKQRKDLQEQLKQASTPEEKQQIQQAIKDVNMQERALNILVGALTGSVGSAVTKEALSTAAEQMRDLMIEDSKKFAGVVDSTGKVLTNLTGESAGVRGDGQKVGGTRWDFDLLCGPANERCATEKNSDNTPILGADGKPKLALNDKGQVEFTAKDANNNPVGIEDFIKTPDGQKMLGDTGGLQGMKGSLFGEPYEAGSWQDKLIESFAGSHDFIGGKVSGLYDKQGNIKQGMTDTERAVYDKGITVGAIPLAAPFAAAEGLSPEVWNAIGILLRAAR